MANGSTSSMNRMKTLTDKVLKNGNGNGNGEKQYQKQGKKAGVRTAKATKPSGEIDYFKIVSTGKQDAEGFTINKNVSISKEEYDSYK